MVARAVRKADHAVEMLYALARPDSEARAGRVPPLSVVEREVRFWVSRMSQKGRTERAKP